MFQWSAGAGSGTKLSDRLHCRRAWGGTRARLSNLKSSIVLVAEKVAKKIAFRQVGLSGNAQILFERLLVFRLVLIILLLLLLSAVGNNCDPSSFEEPQVMPVNGIRVLCGGVLSGITVAIEKQCTFVDVVGIACFGLDLCCCCA